MAHTLAPLPYAFDALEPHIDAKTMEIHSQKHHKAYVDNGNKLIAGTEWETKSLEDIVKGTYQAGAVAQNLTDIHRDRGDVGHRPGIVHPGGAHHAHTAVDHSRTAVGGRHHGGSDHLLGFGLVTDAHGTTVLHIAEGAVLDAMRGGLRADLEMSAAVRTGPLGDVVRHALAARLERLSALLLSAALTRTSARRLVLTVPGVLAEIPWAMLPHMAGRSFSLATSATRWMGERGRGGVGVGVDAGIRAGRLAGFVAGPGVARGEEEVGVAAAAWRARGVAEVVTVLTGADATAAEVGRAAASTDVLHVAAHGRHSAENPMFSGLELVDGPLFGYDIDLMPRVPDTVVLSACELGRSSVRWGEEAVGMTRAWLHAGSQCVVAAPVVVADDVACELLGAMHTHLAAGFPPSDALAAASERTGLRTPFQCYGAGF